jgi:hypothetical protein
VTFYLESIAIVFTVIVLGIKPSVGVGERPEPVFNVQKVNNNEVSQQLSQQFLSKLSQLEKLQYELTKQVRKETFIEVNSRSQGSIPLSI